MRQLTTPRLLLRTQVPADADVMYRLWLERDPRVPEQRRLDASGHPTVTHLRERIVSSRTDFGLLTVVIRASEEVIGYCGLVYSERGGPELAFELLTTMHGRGYATEAGEAVIAEAPAHGHARIWASVWEWNLASRRVLDKLGFRDTGRVLTTGVHGRSLLTVRDLDPRPVP